MASSFSLSPCSSRPTGIPVQLDTTSAMSCGPTCSDTIVSVWLSASSARASWLLQLGDLAVVDLARPHQVALAQRPVGLDPQLVDLLASGHRPG